MRDIQIAEDYMGGLSVPSLSKNHGVSETRIWQILRERGVVGSQNRKTRQSDPLTARPLSKVHEILGRRLSEFEMDRKIDAKELSRRLTWSKQKLTVAKRGHKELTLTELIEISNTLDISIADILSRQGV